VKVRRPGIRSRPLQTRKGALNVRKSTTENADDWNWTIGIVAAPFGLIGEMKVRIETDFPERFGGLKQVGLRLTGRGLKVFDVQRTRIHKGQVLLKVDGIESIDDADVWRGAHVQVKRADAVPLPEGSFYTTDLIGLDVITREGRALGKIERVLAYPAQDLLKVGDALIPAVKEFVVEVDLAGGRIIVAPPDGLLPDEPEADDAD